MAEEVLTMADSQAARIAVDAHDEAAAIREAAERDAAAVREAAEREAAELRAQLDSMYAELSRLTEFLAENLATAPATVTAPALPSVSPGRPGTRPVTRPAKPGTKPVPSPSGPAPKTVGRQAKVMRKFVAAFALVAVIGAVAGVSELALHGLPFFIFRANGAGGTETGPKEPKNPPRAGQPFNPNAEQQAATQHQPTGKHHKPATSTK
ncbi:MAG: hypothetical protein J2P28_12380 [Actinobacteria bacterium]|nr:hypothetical protein [Actinomycetota bacterium]